MGGRQPRVHRIPSYSGVSNRTGINAAARIGRVATTRANRETANGFHLEAPAAAAAAAGRCAQQRNLLRAAHAISGRLHAGRPRRGEDFAGDGLRLRDRRRHPRELHRIIDRRVVAVGEGERRRADLDRTHARSP